MGRRQQDRTATLEVSLRIRDMERTTLLIWELGQLRDEMFRDASPYADKLEATLARYLQGGDDDRPEPPLSCCGSTEGHLPSCETLR